MCTFLLLLGHTDSSSTSPSGLGVLTPDSETPVVSQTSVRPNLLQSLQVFTELRLQVVGDDLRELSILDILLPVEEPIWDLVLPRVRHDRDYLLHLLLGELSSALGEVNVCLLEHNVGVPAPNPLDVRHREHDLGLPVNIRIHYTENVLELFRNHQRHV